MKSIQIQKLQILLFLFLLIGCRDTHDSSVKNSDKPKYEIAEEDMNQNEELNCIPNLINNDLLAEYFAPFNRQESNNVKIYNNESQICSLFNDDKLVFELIHFKSKYFRSTIKWILSKGLLLNGNKYVFDTMFTDQTNSLVLYDIESQIVVFSKKNNILIAINKSNNKFSNEADIINVFEIKDKK